MDLTTIGILALIGITLFLSYWLQLLADQVDELQKELTSTRLTLRLTQLMLHDAQGQLKLEKEYINVTPSRN